MRWLIVEDALRNRVGHWFEYVSTFAKALRESGDEVTILADESAEPFIVNSLNAKPVLPDSIWHKMSDGASSLRRYLRLPVHAWLTRRHVAKWLKDNSDIDVIFVPTVLVHHLLGWIALIKGPLRRMRVRTLLFFPSAPLQLDPNTGEHTWAPSPTSLLFKFLIRMVKSEVTRGRVILGAETDAMRDVLTQLTRVPFQYFPHPVAPLPAAESEAPVASDEAIVMGSYGGARQEKGDDLLVAAVDEYCRRFETSRVSFNLQCVGGKPGEWVRLDCHANVSLIRTYFQDDEYAVHLRSSSVLLLPYRKASYSTRVSRVAIEAMVNGIPIVTTRGTTMASQAAMYGAAVLCEDGSAESLVRAIRECELQYNDLRRLARSRIRSAREHFSVPGFRKVLNAPPSTPVIGSVAAHLPSRSGAQ